jgi:hypothetical protein
MAAIFTRIASRPLSSMRRSSFAYLCTTQVFTCSDAQMAGNVLPWCRQLSADHDKFTQAGSRLRLVPQVGEAGEAQAAAHRLHPEPLVVRRNGARRHALQTLRNLSACGMRGCAIACG